MRDQILAGIHEAMMDADQNLPNSVVGRMVPDDLNLLTAHILAALTEVPEGTPAPRVANLPATPVLMISPAQVVAMFARDAWVEVQENLGLTGPEHMTVLDFAAFEDRREYREYLFRVSPMFGVRVRSITRDQTPLFLIAGYPEQVAAFQRAATMIHELAQPVVADLDTTQRREFWATLGHLNEQGSDDNPGLIEANTQRYAHATAHLNQRHGRVRNLTRTEPTLSGSVYEQAAAVMNGAEGRS